MASPWTNAELIRWTWRHVLWRTKRTTGWSKCSVEPVNVTEHVDLFQHEWDAAVSWTGDVSVVHSVHLRLFMSSCAGRHCRSADVLMDTECSTAQSELSSAFCSDSTYYITCWSHHLNTTWKWWEIWYSQLPPRQSLNADVTWGELHRLLLLLFNYHHSWYFLLLLRDPNHCLRDLQQLKEDILLVKLLIQKDRHWSWRKAAGVFRNRLCVFCENRPTASSSTQISLTFKVYTSYLTHTPAEQFVINTQTDAVTICLLIKLKVVQQEEQQSQTSVWTWTAPGLWKRSDWRINSGINEVFLTWYRHYCFCWYFILFRFALVPCCLYLSD